jgi:peptidoglycan/LPS O-acetylase OafA/YrhL
MGMTQLIKYRPEIDGLRALAVLPVIFFHAGLKLFGGGFVGVDVFFVISGYLITSIILSELEKGTFCFKSFYERRARRILPVLFFVMLCSIPFAWLLLPPSELVSFSKSLIAVPLFISNFFFLSDGNYFESAAELKPLLHTWSLAVEEQYYFFFPIFLVFCWRWSRRFSLIAIVVVALFSLIAAQIGSFYHPLYNFYLLPSRLWEIAIGAIIAFYAGKTSQSSTPLIARQFLSAFGAVFIVASVAVFDKTFPFPSLYALVPTLGTALILLFGHPDTLIGRVLAFRPLVFIGLISYSAYLWHQPVLAFSRHYFATMSTTTTVTMLLGVFLLSSLTWRFVEQPFRQRNIISRKTLWISCLAFTLFFISFGYGSNLFFSTLSKHDFEEKLAEILTRSKAIYFTNMDERKFIKYRIRHETLKPEVIVIGSSRSMQIRESTYGGSLLNLSVSGASIEDRVAIAHMATQKFTPKTILLGVGPWIFNSNYIGKRWMSLHEEYAAALAHLNIESKANINPPTATNKNTLFYALWNFYFSVNMKKYATDDVTSEFEDLILRDGSHVYSTKSSSKTQNQISHGFNGSIGYGLDDFQHSEELEELFTKFVKSYSKNYKLVLVLAPYHPKLYEQMKSERPVYIKVENLLREFASTNGVAIIGSYNPEKVGCSELEFYDGSHPKEACMKKVLKSLPKD